MNVAGPFFRAVACVLAFSVAAYPASNPSSASAAQTAAPNATQSAAQNAKKPAHKAHPQVPSDPATASTKRLETLARQLKQKNPGAAYSQLSVIADQKSSGILGMRAALALGYYDLNKNRYAEAVKWLEPA